MDLSEWTEKNKVVIILKNPVLGYNAVLGELSAHGQDGSPNLLRAQYLYLNDCFLTEMERGRFDHPAPSQLFAMLIVPKDQLLSILVDLPLIEELEKRITAME